MVNKQIENNFTYHAPTSEDVESFKEMRTQMKQIAYLIDECCPDSREKSLAMTKLEEANMWANASIARID